MIPSPAQGDDAMIDDPADLELSEQQMLTLGRAVLERCVAHVGTLHEQPATGDLEGAEEACRAIREPVPPEEGSPLDPLLDRLFEEWVPRSFTSSGPGYLGYVPGGGVFPAALADLIQDTTNRYTGVRAAAPLLVQLEANVLSWFRGWIGMPQEGGGMFTTGGSTANLNGIVCARDIRLGPNIRPGVLYTSSQAHHSVLKAARIAGIAEDRVRAIDVDEDYRMRVDLLADAISADRRRGLTPFLVASSAGTTNTGAIDPLEAIAALCAEERMWHHVDAAYGGFFVLCDELQPRLEALGRADSVTMDPHKGLFLPYGTGTLLVRDRGALRAVHGQTANYLPDVAGEELYDPSQLSPDLSRGFPGLRVWMTLQLYGTRRIAAALSEKRALAVEAAQRVAALPGIELVAPPQLSLFAFHMSWPGASLEQENAATRQLLDRVNRRNHVLLSGCTVGESRRFLARVCILNFRTRRARVETCIQDIAEESKAILSFL
jgi:aromatic-L-amino-acid decarboxylase